MKRALPIGFFIGFLLLFQFETKASHVLGSELVYSFTDVYNVKLNLKVYRDCSECKFNGNGGGVNTDNCSEIPPIEVYGFNNITGKKVFLTSLTISRQGISNITNSCVGLTNACDLTSTPILNSGIEVHDFIANFNTQSYELNGYCNFFFTSSIFSRSDEITPPNSPIEKFFNYSELNVCAGIRTNSVKLTSRPNFMVNAGSPIFHSPGVDQGDADSISVKLVPALSDFDKEIQYVSGMSYNMPFTVASCGGSGCAPDPLANPPTGFYFDSKTGNTVYTPQFSGQVGTLVYEITKWKRSSSSGLVVVSRVRRDFMIRTITGTNVEPIFENDKDAYTVCTNSKIIIPIIVKESQNVSFNTNNLPDGMSYTPSSMTTPYYTGMLSWTPADSFAGKTFLVTVDVTDNNCPLNATSSKTFILKVHATPNLSISLTQKSCGKVELVGKPAAYPDNMYIWRVTYPNTVTKEYWGRKQEIEHLYGGLLNVELSLNQVCKGTIVSAITLPLYTPPTFSLASDYIACAGTNITVVPMGVSGNAPFKYYWNDALGTSFFVKPAGSDFALDAKIEDKDGCVQTVSTVLKSYPKLTLHTKDSSFCSLDSGRFVLNGLLTHQHVNISQGFELLGGGTQLLNDNGEWYFLKQDFSKTMIVFRAWVQDENGCKYYDTFNIYKKSGLDFTDHLIGDFCNTANKLDLYQHFGLKKEDGFFEALVYGVIENGGLLNPAAFTSSGMYDVYFMSSPKYCSKTTNLHVNIFTIPNISWIHSMDSIYCQNSENVQLNANSGSGHWTGKGVTGSLFNPTDPEIKAGEPFYITYSENEPVLGCIATDSVKIWVYKAPSFEMTFMDGFNNALHSQVCINTPVFVKLTPQFDESTFPFEYSNSLSTNRGLLVNSRLQPDSDAGKHILTLKTSSGICPDVQNSKEIEFEKLPQISVEPFEQFYCEQDNEIKLHYVTLHTTQLEWYMNQNKMGESNLSESDFIFSNAKSGVYTLKVKLTNGVCKNEVVLADTLVISPIPQPIIAATPSVYVPNDMRLVSIQDAGKYSFPISKRRWLIEDKEYTNQISISHRIKAVEGEIPIHLYVEDIYGCSAEVESVLYISAPLDIYIPNAFSPDNIGPEINNQFKVNAEHALEFKMMIVNKWGETVFSTTNPDMGWDGTFLGAKCPGDVYVYYIKVVNQLGGTREFRGTITLLR